MYYKDGEKIDEVDDILKELTNILSKLNRTTSTIIIDPKAVKELCK